MKKIKNILCILLACAIWLYGIYHGVEEQKIKQYLQQQLYIAEGELDVASEHLQLERENSRELAAQLRSANESLDQANEVILTLKHTEYQLVYLGDFKLTHYCCEKRNHICGTGDGITATGTQVTAGRTIAVDPKVIPYGSEVYIEGYGFRTAEDTGGAIKGNHIDIAVDTHEDTNDFGVKSGGVWLLVRKNY